MYTIEFYVPIKKNEIITSVGKWIQEDIIMLKVTKTDSERQILHVFSQRQTLDLHFYLHVSRCLCVPMCACVSV